MGTAPPPRAAASSEPQPPPPSGPSEDEQMIMHLERDQLVAETLRPVAPARLSPRLQLGLWALRVFAILVSAMVIYTFVARL